jgi:hypothetical protein
MYHTPVSRLKQYYADTERVSTISYVEYCVRRLYPDGGVVLTWNEKSDEETEVDFRLSSLKVTHVLMVRFRVPLNSQGTVVKDICREASHAMTAMRAVHGN